MRTLSQKEQKIALELIKNPRSSDNSISKNTKIPVKTVNRKRKKLEEEGLLHYYAAIDYFKTGVFSASNIFEIKFKLGISRTYFLERFKSDNQTKFDAKHYRQSMLGESDGHLLLIIIVDSRHESDMLEIYNTEIVPKINDLFGHDAIYSTKVIKLTNALRILHNYVYEINMSDGLIKSDWSDELLFVGE